MSGRVEGFGSITWWGFSPAVDLTALARGSGQPAGPGGGSADPFVIPIRVSGAWSIVL